MKCKQIKEKFPDFLIGEIDQKSREEIQSHLASCSSCRDELETLSETWTKLGVLPEEQPSNALRTRFYEMIGAYKQELGREKSSPRLKKHFVGWLEGLRPKMPVFQLSSALIFLVIGLAIGYFFLARGTGTSDIVRLRQEVHNMRQLVAVSLLEQQSPHQRLRGVSWGSRVERPDSDMLAALLQTLNSDPNVNVRLAVVDALYLFNEHPTVRQGLIQSLSQQTSPLVQIALIDLVMEIRERRSIEALRQLIQDEELIPEVKERAELGIKTLS